MFVVKWFQSGKEDSPIEVEHSIFTDLDSVVAFCQDNHAGMRLRHVTTPPDGFIVFDVDANELRRWFGSQSEDDSAYYTDLPVFWTARER